MKRLTIPLLTVFVLLTISYSAHSAPIKYNYSGLITRVIDVDNILEGTIVEGESTFSGSFLYYYTTPICNGYGTEYCHTLESVDVEDVIKGGNYNFSLPGQTFHHLFFNDSDTASSFKFYAMPQGPLAINYSGPTDSWSSSFNGEYGVVLESSTTLQDPTTPPTYLPDLNFFDISKRFFLGGVSADFSTSFYISGTVSSLMVEITEPDIEVSPVFYDFGNVAWMGSPRSTLINIANTGGQDLTVSDLSIVEPSGDFIVGTLPNNVATADTPIDLEVSFAPAMLGYQEGTLQINSNDPDEPEVYVALSGVGVLSEETDEQVEAVNTFIEDEVAADNLTPDKKNSVKNIKDMLTTYGDLIADGFVEDACAQLSDIYKKVDGKPSPPDKLEGPSLETLQDVIENMLIQDCGGVDLGGECFTDGQCLSGECYVPGDANHGVCVEDSVIPLPPGAMCEPGVDVCVDGYVCADSAELPYPPYIYKCLQD